MLVLFVSLFECCQLLGNPLQVVPVCIEHFTLIYLHSSLNFDIQLLDHDLEFLLGLPDPDFSFQSRVNCDIKMSMTAKTPVFFSGRWYKQIIL